MLKDDWFVFHFDHDHSRCVGPQRGACEPTRTEVHEMRCSHDRCYYRPGPCVFHPVGCECSEGACQGAWEALGLEGGR